MNRNRNLLIFFLFCSIIFNQVTPISILGDSSPLVDCIIIKYSECSICATTYELEIQPFYERYRDNETIDFTVIDAATQPEVYWNVITGLEINVNDYGNLPWVIFSWGEQVEVLDAVHLDMIESTFNTILTDIGYVPTDPGNSSPGVEILRLDLLLIAGTFNLILFGVSGLGAYTYRAKFTSERLLVRISKSRYLVIIALSFLSIIALTYQLLDHIQGGCGCATTNIVKSLLFRRYDHIMILGINIPFALLGLGLMFTIIFLVSLIAFLPVPFKINLPSERFLTINERILKNLYNILVFISFFGVLSLFYLLYLEIFVIEFICLLCTLSQLVIVANTTLIITWHPLIMK